MFFKIEIDTECDETTIKNLNYLLWGAPNGLPFNMQDAIRSRSLERITHNYSESIFYQIPKERVDLHGGITQIITDIENYPGVKQFVHLKELDPITIDLNQFNAMNDIDRDNLVYGLLLKGDN